jgi:magnesium transporter
MTRVIKDKEKDGFLWLDIVNPTMAELKEISVTYQIDESSILDAMGPDQLPKYEQLEEWVFIMLRVYDEQSKMDADTIQELSRKLAIFYSDNTVISIHRTDLPVLEYIFRNKLNIRKCGTPVMAIFQMIEKSLNSFNQPAHRLLKELDDYESDIFIRKQTPDVLKSLYHLKRKAAVSNRILNLSTDIIDHIDNHALPEMLIQDLRDLYIRLDTMYNEVQEGVNNLLNIYISLSSQKTNEVVRVLTVFSVFFLPLTFIVGIYGMNFEHMPELTMKYGYPGVIILMAIVTLVIYLSFKRRGWL